jgi:biotin synthase
MAINHSAKKVRVSLGSAVVLGLTSCMLEAKPTTAYLLTYTENGCVANCAFCLQARESNGRADMLSRVTWPAFPAEDVTFRIGQASQEGMIERVCVQALNYRHVAKDILGLVKDIRKYSNVPVSVSCQPLTREDMIKFAQAGVSRFSIALDASTRDLFEKVKGSANRGPYVWEEHVKALKEAVMVFGRNSVTTHLIVGLGETEEELVRMIQWCMDNGIHPSLFAFTPVAGTKLEDHPTPPIGSYRRVQLAQHLITRSIATYKDMRFEEGRLVDTGISERELDMIVGTGDPFRTSGCPGCNRPYYNERPGGTIYNFPLEPSRSEIERIKEQLSDYG